MSAPPGDVRLESRGVALLLSFTGGYVDTFSFVALFGLFTAHVTGNFVLIGAALAGQGHSGILGKLLALPVFVAGVAATRWFERRSGLQERRAAIALVAVQLVGLIAFMGFGLAAGPLADGDAPAAVGVGLLGVAAMAVQNAAARSAFMRLSPSTVMTGNVTQVTMDLVDLLVADVDRQAVAGRIARLWPPIVAFAAGAIASGLLVAVAGFWALVLPQLALVVLLLRLR